MGGKFSIAGTVIGVFTIQTLKSTITFLGVPPPVSPLFLALVVIVVVLIQSRRVRGWAKGVVGAFRPRIDSDPRGGAEVAS
jgi:simple sugar transport system permease protein